MIMRACPFVLADVAKATGGELIGDGHAGVAGVSGVSTDTRDDLRGALFVALRGDRFDAHEFLDRAVAGGASALLIDRAAHARPPSNVPLLLVDDTLRALGDLAAFHRARIGVPAIALTGSNGKTTTKEMIASIMGASRRVLKTEGNLNNLIGVPMTVFGLTTSHELAVIEMGMNTPGEIARYTEIAKPSVGLVLNVGPAHIGMLGSMDAIANAKGELFAGLGGAGRSGGVGIVNLDDPQVVRVSSSLSRRRTFGRDPSADVRLMSYAATASGGVAKYLVDGTALELELTIAGEHNALNAAGAIAACTAHAPDIRDATVDEIRSGLKNASYVARRMVFEPIGEYLVVDDCYNANSASMLAAIETVRARAAAEKRRFVALLGEMREQGVFSDEEHAKVGRAAAAAMPAHLGAFGSLAAPIFREASAAKIDAHHEVEDIGAMWSWLRDRLKPGDIILVKGSRGMKMERFIEKLRGGSA